MITDLKHTNRNSPNLNFLSLALTPASSPLITNALLLLSLKDSSQASLKLTQNSPIRALYCTHTDNLTKPSLLLLISFFIGFLKWLNCLKTNFAINLSLISLNGLVPSVFPATLAVVHPRVYVPFHVPARVNFSKKKILCSNQGLNPSPHNSTSNV